MVGGGKRIIAAVATPEDLQDDREVDDDDEEDEDEKNAKTRETPIYIVRIIPLLCFHHLKF